VVGGGERYQARTAVFAGEGEVNVFRFQKILMTAEVVREGAGGDAGDADFEEEVGGCARPGGLATEERSDGVENGRGWSFVEGVDDGFRVIRESGSGPVGGVGVSRRGVEARGGEVSESGADGVAKRGENFGAEGFELGPEIGFCAACGGGKRREADGDCTSSQSFIGIPAAGGGDEDGAVKFDWERLAGVTLFMQEEGGAGGESAQGGGKARANGASVIEGENPIVLGDGEQFLHGGGKGEKRSGRGIDEGADHAGGGGLAAGGWTVENENGMRAGGVKSG